MTNQVTNNEAKSIQCCFCNDEYKSSEIGEHLMLCGNKTDQCPKCQKYIRRAVFAYHYENNCANLDETEGEPSGATRKLDNVPTVVSTNTPQSSMSFITKNKNSFTTVANNIPRTSQSEATSSWQSSSSFYTPIPVITSCSLCAQQYEVDKERIHQERCLRNLNNMTKIQTSHPNSGSNYNSDESKYDYRMDDTADIPCEICNEPIEPRYYLEHVNACAKREDERAQNQLKSTNEAIQHSYVRCQYCDEKYITIGRKTHEATCHKNPGRLALEKRFQSVFYLPPITLYSVSPDLWH